MKGSSLEFLHFSLRSTRARLFQGCFVNCGHRKVNHLLYYGVSNGDLRKQAPRLTGGTLATAGFRLLTLEKYHVLNWSHPRHHANSASLSASPHLVAPVVVWCSLCKISSPCSACNKISGLPGIARKPSSSGSKILADWAAGVRKEEPSTICISSSQSEDISPRRSISASFGLSSISSRSLANAFSRPSPA